MSFILKRSNGQNEVFRVDILENGETFRRGQLVYICMVLRAKTLESD